MIVATRFKNVNNMGLPRMQNSVSTFFYLQGSVGGGQRGQVFYGDPLWRIEEGACDEKEEERRLYDVRKQIKSSSFLHTPTLVP